MDKVRELFNFVPSDKSVSIAAWINLALNFITVELSIWYILKSLLRFSFIKVIIGAITLVLLLVCMYFNKRYIDGIKERDYWKMLPFRGTFLVATVIELYYFNIVAWIILLPVSFYLFKIFNSLYVKIRDENVAGNSATQGSGNQTMIAINSEVEKECDRTY